MLKMTKPRIRYVCNSCGTVLTRWEGRCPSCKEWGSLEEEILQKHKTHVRHYAGKQQRDVVRLKDIEITNEQRLTIPGDSEIQRVLGGGIVPGSLILIGGQPGIGKSTLMLQMACNLPHKVLYISGEESESQIKLRASRVAKACDECLILCETNMEQVIHHAGELSPDLLFVDSIQTAYSSSVDAIAGSVTQIRTCAAQLQSFARKTNTPVFIIGHITKEGNLAGPKLLEHIVDVVLQFEGDRHYIYRILRTTKNRYGSTDEIGIYEMESNGLRPVANPSELLISPVEESLSGTSIGCTLEGARPLLIETQALVSPSVYGQPQRSCTGYDTRRLNMLLAVLEKRCHLYFGQHDVFLNMAGGLKIMDPAIDLAIVAALISSLNDIPVDKKICFAGEVGLSGEIRTVNRIEQRILEAERLGFEQIVVSQYQKKNITDYKSIEVRKIGKVTELVDLFFT